MQAEPVHRESMFNKRKKKKCCTKKKEELWKHGNDEAREILCDNRVKQGLMPLAIQPLNE